MITNFKIFENNQLTSDLIDYADQRFVDDIFDNEYHIDGDEAMYMYPGYIWSNFDEERFVNDFKQGMEESMTLEDIYDDELKKFIKDNLSIRKKEKIVELYKDNYFDEDESESNYDLDDYENMIDDFDDDELREIIEDDNEEYEVVEQSAKNMYGEYTAIDILYDFHGIDGHFYDKKDTHSFRDTYDDKYKELKNAVINYVDLDGIAKEWKDNEDSEYRKEFVQEYIYDNEDIQRSILSNNKPSVLDLFELFVDKKGSNIGDEYKFQKAYIEEFVDDEDDNNIPTALKNLYDNFTLDGEIEKEYSEHMWKVYSDKYNI